VKYNGKAANVIIPAGVTAIGDGAFYKCTGLTSVTIPASVRSIGNYAFAMIDSPYESYPRSLATVSPLQRVASLLLSGRGHLPGAIALKA